jgi:hypothetical protein
VSEWSFRGALAGPARYHHNRDRRTHAHSIAITRAHVRAHAHSYMHACMQTHMQKTHVRHLHGRRPLSLVNLPAAPPPAAECGGAARGGESRTPWGCGVLRRDRRISRLFATGLRRARRRTVTVWPRFSAVAGRRISSNRRRGGLQGLLPGVQATGRWGMAGSGLKNVVFARGRHNCPWTVHLSHTLDGQVCGAGSVP